VCKHRDVFAERVRENLTAEIQAVHWVASSCG
jgi:hypothetical protein